MRCMYTEIRRYVFVTHRHDTDITHTERERERQAGRYMRYPASLSID